MRAPLENTTITKKEIPLHKKSIISSFISSKKKNSSFIKIISSFLAS